MILTIRRFEHRADATMGELLIDGDFECYTQEAPIRTDRVFVPGESALPPGFYNVSLAMSAKHKRILPLLASCRPKLDTADSQPDRRMARVGMWIHPGRAMLDCDGLLVVGQANEGRIVTRTKLAFDALMTKLAAATRTRGEAIDCEIL